MSKTNVIAVIVVVAVGSLALYMVASKQPVVVRYDPIGQLLVPSDEWLAKYGSEPDSVLAFNVLVNNKALESHRNVIVTMAKKMNMIGDPNDPNDG